MVEKSTAETKSLARSLAGRKGLPAAFCECQDIAQGIAVDGQMSGLAYFGAFQYERTARGNTIDYCIGTANVRLRIMAVI